MEYNLENNNNTNINVTNNFIQLKNISNDTLISKKKKLIEISKDLSKLEYLEIFNKGLKKIDLKNLENRYLNN